MVKLLDVTVSDAHNIHVEYIWEMRCAQMLCMLMLSLPNDPWINRAQFFRAASTNKWVLKCYCK